MTKTPYRTSRSSRLAVSLSSRTAKTAAPITGPSSVPRPPNATITRTRTSTRSKLYVAGLMKPAL